jgi:4-azaleucine resistance transporter AzlC
MIDALFGNFLSQPIHHSISRAFNIMSSPHISDSPVVNSQRRQAEFGAGVQATIPLLVGSAPFGIIFGALALNNGLSPFTAQGLSLFVFAGSSQFVAADMWKRAAESGILVIILATFIVNLRHALYSATLAPKMKHLPGWMLIPIAFLLTDEAFVVAAARYEQPDKSPNKHWFYLGTALSMYVNWQFWTFVGIVAASSVPREQIAQLGLDFAASATFIGMLIPLIKDRPTVLAALAAGGTALVFAGLPSKLGLIIAALVGVMVGLLAENGQPKKRVEQQEEA